MDESTASVDFETDEKVSLCSAEAISFADLIPLNRFNTRFEKGSPIR